MSRCILRHQYEVVAYDKDEVADCLMSMAYSDCDFNGQNGPEYLWDEAEGFESNAEYCLSVAQQEPTLREMIEKFISMWMGRDQYYEDFDIAVLVQDDKLFISLAYTISA
jgi:hypothetical protein